jgi:hypothetical protein
MSERPSFTCPRCGMVSHHPLDVLEGYCGNCHDWTAPRPGRRPHHYGRDGRPMSMREWSARLEDDLAYKHVRASAPLEGVEVSTVWIGLDYRMLGLGPPLIFETMVFGGELDGHARRWSTEGEAEAGHDRVVAEVLQAHEVDR